MVIVSKRCAERHSSLEMKKRTVVRAILSGILPGKSRTIILEIGKKIIQKMSVDVREGIKILMY